MGAASPQYGVGWVRGDQSGPQGQRRPRMLYLATIDVDTEECTRIQRRYLQVNNAHDYRLRSSRRVRIAASIVLCLGPGSLIDEIVRAASTRDINQIRIEVLTAGNASVGRSYSGVDLDLPAHGCVHAWARNGGLDLTATTRNCAETARYSSCPQAGLEPVGQAGHPADRRRYSASSTSSSADWSRAIVCMCPSAKTIGVDLTGHHTVAPHNARRQRRQGRLLTPLRGRDPYRSSATRC